MTDGAEYLVGWVDCPACGLPVLVTWSAARCRTTIHHGDETLRYEDIELGIKPEREEAALATARTWAAGLHRDGSGR